MRVALTGATGFIGSHVLKELQEHGHEVMALVRDREQADRAARALGLGEDVRDALEAQPTRGALAAPVPTDPTIYRFYEIVQVYGPTIKELIHEEFGDGIMSAINFRFDVKRVPDPAGDRVVVTLDGKFLPYQW